VGSGRLGAICLRPWGELAGERLLWVPHHALVPSLALSSLNKHAEAVAYYKKALELDPDNDTYKSNLKIAELKLREAPSPVSSVLTSRGGGGIRVTWQERPG
jgi:tetratricopeptide (TPR) repeat protein